MKTLLLILLLLVVNPITVDSLGISPSFPRTEITDDFGDFMNSSYNSVTGNLSTDIQTVNYFSDGKMLIVTLWLFNPFNVFSNNVTNYGMYIDVDSNKQTGVKGVDYQIEVSGTRGNWTRSATEWSNLGFSRNYSIDSNYKNFFGEPEEHYVLLYGDLEEMGFPDRYKVIFYAEEIKENDLAVDFTNWVPIPPPEFILTTTPSSLNLRQGDKATIELQIKSTSGFEPDASFFVLNKPPDIDIIFKAPKVHVPSYGMATISADIKVSDNADVEPQTLYLHAIADFPSETFIQPSNSINLPDKPINNVTTATNIVINIDRKLTWLENLTKELDKIQGLIGLFSGIALDRFGPFLYHKLVLPNFKTFISKVKRVKSIIQKKK